MFYFYYLTIGGKFGKLYTFFSLGGNGILILEENGNGQPNKRVWI